MILRMASIYLIEAIGLNKEKVLECLLKHGLKRNVPATVYRCAWPTFCLLRLYFENGML